MSNYSRIHSLIHSTRSSCLDLTLHLQGPRLNAPKNTALSLMHTIQDESRLSHEFFIRYLTSNSFTSVPCSLIPLWWLLCTPRSLQSRQHTSDTKSQEIPDSKPKLLQLHSSVQVRLPSTCFENTNLIYIAAFRTKSRIQSSCLNRATESHLCLHALSLLPATPIAILFSFLSGL
jgi:hypothetical protein